jgi:hypothetical protein
MHDSQPPFSGRYGFRGPEAEITVREDAPEILREGIVMLGYAAGLGPGSLRSDICEVLLKLPDRNNWGPSNIEYEVAGLVADAPWYKIYDIAEKLYGTIAKDDYEGVRAPEFERRLNELFSEHGIGWQMDHGRILARGSEAFTLVPRAAVEAMQQAGKPTAANEVHEALTDISRRPKADVTGAIQHAMAALECVARDVVGSTETLGRIIPALNLPKPLDTALEKLWGFASEQGRHIREGRDPAFPEAELVVTVASAVSLYLLRADARAKSGN